MRKACHLNLPHKSLRHSPKTFGLSKKRWTCVIQQSLYTLDVAHLSSTGLWGTKDHVKMDLDLSLFIYRLIACLHSVRNNEFGFNLLDLFDRYSCVGAALLLSSSFGKSWSKVGKCLEIKKYVNGNSKGNFFRPETCLRVFFRNQSLVMFFISTGNKRKIIAFVFFSHISCNDPGGVIF